MVTGQSIPAQQRSAVCALSATFGERATLVVFTSAFCLPCHTTRHVLDNVAGMVPGVRLVEVDAEQHLELVRTVGVQSTPTTLVLDADGVEVTRATGVPRRVDVVAALGRAIGDPAE